MDMPTPSRSTLIRGTGWDGEDASAVTWMYKFTRDPLPAKVVWKQDDVTQARYYWLRVNEENQKGGSLVTAAITGQSVQITAEGIDSIVVRLNDTMIDLDQPISVVTNGKKAFEGKVGRSLAVLRESLYERGDPASVFSAEVTAKIH